jgi:endonuclease G, mitochondrial
MWLDPRTYARARAALKVGVQQHLFDPNMNMVDIGYRIREREDGRLIEEPTVRFHLHEKLRGPQFEAFAFDQPERVIPDSIMSIPTDVIQSSYHLSVTWGGWGGFTRPQNPIASNPRARAADPMQGGLSISDGYSGGYGTLGGLVQDRQTGAPMMLSNFHVLASRGYARPGMSVLQPGRGDGGTQVIALFERHGMDQGLDAAVARLNGSRPLVNQQLELQPVTGVNAPQLGMRVCKSGRASGITHGVISGIGGVLKIRYPISGERLIRHVAHIVPLYQGAVVSAPGDSGSSWLDATSYQAVGLHFAGADQPEYALAIDMAQVTSALDIEVGIG